MSRSVRDSKLETRAARLRLKPRGKPYFKSLEPGLLHLGYRKPLSGTGKWVVRHYIGDRSYEVETIAPADDYGEADGRTILSFAQAQAAARQRMVARAGGGGIAPGFTVRKAVEGYLAGKIAEGRDTIDSDARARAHIFPELGNLDCAALTTEKIRTWHRDLAKNAPRARTKPGKAQRYRVVKVNDRETTRRRQASANRVLTILKAALNHNFEDGKIASDLAWRKVKPFRGTDAARLRYLQMDEARRLINACPPDFRRMVQAALQTGARYGQLAALRVSDFNPDAGTVLMRTRKGDGTEKTFHCTLTREGVLFFAHQVKGRAGNELMFEKSRTSGDDDHAWHDSEQTRPMAEACTHARLSPPIGFHGLRHTWASHSVMNGVPLIVVAKNLGHADTRMVERHYGHLAPSYLTEAIRAGAPRFVSDDDNKVVAMG